MLFSQWEGAPELLFGPGILKWVIMLAPLGFVLVLSFGINKLSTGTAQILYWAFAFVMGLSLASIFFVYTNASIALTFFATAAAFASLSLWGYTTKKDLTGWGTFLLMGVVGIIVASLINVFWQNDTFSLAIAGIGVLIFAGLTAYDTQKIKSIYFELQGTEFLGKAAIMGALASISTSSTCSCCCYACSAAANSGAGEAIRWEGPVETPGLFLCRDFEGNSRYLRYTVAAVEREMC